MTAEQAAQLAVTFENAAEARKYLGGMKQRIREDIAATLPRLIAEAVARGVTEALEAR